MEPIGLNHYLLLGAVLFVLGVIGVLARRNAIGILISIELMLNAVNVNLIAFSRFSPNSQSVLGTTHGLSGQVFALFIIILAACEAAIALAIIINVFNSFGSIDVDEADTLRG